MRSVLVTGASTGIGRASALQLEAEGWRVFAGVRQERDAQALRDACSDRLVPVMLDITDVKQVSAVARQISEAVGGSGLDGLVNNAGIIVVGPLETLPIDDFRNQLEVNLIAQVAVAQELLPLIRQAGGRVVFVGSIGGRMSYPFGAAYHASKYGLEAVADCLRQELRPWKINVAMIEPGAIDTEIFERGERLADAAAARAPIAQARLYKNTIDRMLKMGKTLQAHASPPERVAKAIAHALDAPRPRRRYRVGLDAHVQVLMHRLLPDRTIDWAVAKALGI